jgi:serine/threonine-protein kinase
MTAITSRLSTALAGRYKIERHLGEGGMATVYLAEDMKHDRKVALKVLKAELAAVLGAERFVQEIKTTASLQHPHILPLFDSGEADGFLYYVMPFIDGETLRDKLERETQLGIEESVDIVVAIADALDYAHRHGVIHRDIKPENILLHDGRPMVADFGIALAVSAAAGGRMTETGLSLGTPHYMSPEQAPAEKDLTARSDVYSLASVLYEMLTGEPPHTGASAQAVVMRIVTDDARPVAELRKSVPPHVAQATGKALEKLPADRFDSAAAFAEALSNPASFTMPATQAAAMATSSGGWRHRMAPLLVAVAAVLLVTTLWGWLRPPVDDPEPVTRYRLVAEEGQAPLPLFGTSIALSPDGNLLVYAGPGDQGRRLWVRERDALMARPLPGTDGGHQPFFAPDGQRVGFVTVDRKLKVISLTGEPPRTVLDSGLNRSSGSWGPDDYLYFSLRSGTLGLSRIHLAGGDPEPVTVPDPATGVGHRWPDALPNGKGVLFVVGRGGTLPTEEDEIAVVDLATGEHRPLLQGIFARYVSGYVLFVTFEGALLAAPFDEDDLEVTGAAEPLLAGMQVVVGPDLAISRSGRLAYAPGQASVLEQGPDELVWVDREGNAREIDPDWTEDFAALSLSPDGSRLAVMVRGDDGTHLWTKLLDDGPQSRFTFEGSFNATPDWHADGDAIAFTSNRDSVPGVYAKAADGSAGAELLFAFPEGLGGPRWSPAGEWMVFYSLGSDSDILAIRPGVDSTPTVVAGERGAEEDSPRVSYDGRWVAYESNETGQPEVFVRPFPDGSTKWQVSADGGNEPRWAHSGQELFYRNLQDDMVVVDVQLTPSFAAGAQRVLFAGGALDNDRFEVAPDDQSFIFVRNRFRDDILAALGQLIVVEGFLQELKAKLGN